MHKPKNILGFKVKIFDDSGVPIATIKEPNKEKMQGKIKSIFEKFK